MNKYNGLKSFYVSYAKDICCELIKNTTKEELTMDRIISDMKLAIKLVKNADEAFTE